MTEEVEEMMTEREIEAQKVKMFVLIAVDQGTGNKFVLFCFKFERFF